MTPPPVVARWYFNHSVEKRVDTANLLRLNMTAVLRNGTLLQEPFVSDNPSCGMLHT
jgi:hypothetical protein